MGAEGMGPGAGGNPTGWWGGVSLNKGPGPKVAWPTLFHLRSFLMASARISSLKSFAEASGLGGERSDRETVPFGLSPTVAQGVQHCSLWAKIWEQKGTHTSNETKQPQNIMKKSVQNKRWKCKCSTLHNQKIGAECWSRLKRYLVQRNNLDQLSVSKINIYLVRKNNHSLKLSQRKMGNRNEKMKNIKFSPRVRMEEKKKDQMGTTTRGTIAQ